MLKPLIRDVEEITAANQWAKRQAEAEAYRQASKERMQRQARKAAKRHRGNRLMANVSYVLMGFGCTMCGICLGAGELAAGGVFGLVVIAAIGGALGYEQR